MYIGGFPPCTCRTQTTESVTETIEYDEDDKIVRRTTTKTTTTMPLKCNNHLYGYGAISGGGTWGNSSTYTITTN